MEVGVGGWDEAGKGAAKGGRKGVGKEAGKGRGGQVCWQGAGRRCKVQRSPACRMAAVLFQGDLASLL